MLAKFSHVDINSPSVNNDQPVTMFTGMHVDYPTPAGCYTHEPIKIRRSRLIYNYSIFIPFSLVRERLCNC